MVIFLSHLADFYHLDIGLAGMIGALASADMVSLYLIYGKLLKAELRLWVGFFVLSAPLIGCLFSKNEHSTTLHNQQKGNQLRKEQQIVFLIATFITVH